MVLWFVVVDEPDQARRFLKAIVIFHRIVKFFITYLVLTYRYYVLLQQPLGANTYGNRVK